MTRLLHAFTGSIFIFILITLPIVSSAQECRDDRSDYFSLNDQLGNLKDYIDFGYCKQVRDNKISQDITLAIRKSDKLAEQIFLHFNIEFTSTEGRTMNIDADINFEKDDYVKRGFGKNAHPKLQFTADKGICTECPVVDIQFITVKDVSFEFLSGPRKGETLSRTSSGSSSGTVVKENPVPPAPPKTTTAAVVPAKKEPEPVKESPVVKTADVNTTGSSGDVAKSAGTSVPSIGNSNSSKDSDKESKEQKKAKELEEKQKAKDQKAKEENDRKLKEQEAKDQQAKAALDKATKEKEARDQQAQAAQDKAAKDKEARDQQAKAAQDKIAKDKEAKDLQAKNETDKKLQEKLAKEQQEKDALDKKIKERELKDQLAQQEKEKKQKEKEEKASKDKKKDTDKKTSDTDSKSKKEETKPEVPVVTAAAEPKHEDVPVETTPVVTEKPVTTTEVTPPPPASIPLPFPKEEYEEKVKDRVNQLQLYLVRITDKKNSINLTNGTIDQALKLFINNGDDAIVGVSSLSSTTVKKSRVKDYLTNLSRLPYQKVDITWSEIFIVDNFKLGPDGNYHATVSFEQTFKGYNDNNMVYGDVTRKNIEIFIKPYSKLEEGELKNFWDILLGDIRVSQTEKLR